MAFRGKDEHTLDDRGRVAIPARYRHEFGAKAVLTIGPEGCVTVYTESGFQEMSTELASAPASTAVGRQSRRDFDAQSFDADLDRQGRILVPQEFREKANLHGPVIIAGAREYLEIWNPERWSRITRDGTAASSPEQGPVG